MTVTVTLEHVLTLGGLLITVELSGGDLHGTKAFLGLGLDPAGLPVTWGGGGMDQQLAHDVDEARPKAGWLNGTMRVFVRSNRAR